MITEAQHDRLEELAVKGTVLSADDAALLRHVYEQTKRSVARDLTGRRLTLREDKLSDPDRVMVKDENFRSFLTPEVVEWMKTQLHREPVRMINGQGVIWIIFKSERDASLFKLFWS